VKISPRLKTELLRFGLVGGLAVGFDAASYFGLIAILDMNPDWAKRASFAIGSVWAFFANKYFTFGVRELRLREPFVFTAVYLVGWLLNSLVHDLTLHLSDRKWLAFLAATAVSTCTNFAGQKFLVFKRQNSPSP
jgi:putative flippase GtrA